MPRFLPSVEVVCHVCGRPYTIEHSFDPQRGGAKQEAKVCPHCDAPLRTVPPRDIGTAKGLLLTLLGAKFYRKEYGDVSGFLDKHARTEEDVEAYLSLVEAMDYGAWERANTDRLRRSANAGLRAETALIAKARAQAQAGTLMPHLREAAEPFRSALAAERTHHLAIFAERQKHV